jgi:hypothetical protein
MNKINTKSIERVKIDQNHGLCKKTPKINQNQYNTGAIVHAKWPKIDQFKIQELIGKGVKNSQNRLKAWANVMQNAQKCMFLHLLS